MLKKNIVFKFLFLIACFSLASSKSFAGTVTKSDIDSGTSLTGTISININDMFGETGSPSSFTVDSIGVKQGDLNSGSETVSMTIDGTTFTFGGNNGGVATQCSASYETLNNYSNQSISSFRQSGSNYFLDITYSASSRVGTFCTGGQRFILQLVATAEFGDSTPPTMAITSSTVSDGDTSNDSSIALTFTSSEATTDFVVDDVSVSGGSLTNFAASSSTVYTATFTPSGDGATTIDVSANTFNDAASNGNTAASQFNWTYDSTVATVSSFSLSDTALKIGDTAIVTLVFSEAVTGFSSDDDVTVQNASLTTMSTSDNITWTGTLTPSSSVEDASNILSLATTYTDLGGNAGPSATTANYSVETIRPSVSSFVLADTDLDAGETTTVTLVFSEAVSSFSSGDDITVQNGSLTTMSSSDNITWTGTFTPTSSTDDTSIVNKGKVWISIASKWSLALLG